MNQSYKTRQYDILFLHPPSSFNKGRDPLSGVFSSGKETHDLFLISPLGVSALYNRLKSQGFAPGFLNVGRIFYEKMKQGKTFNLAEIMGDLSSMGIGIDLHWAVHTPGALDLAKSVKKKFPESFVFLGGLTATYFYKEILKEYHYIDAVVLGEADEAIVPLAEALKENGSRTNLGKVPNLAYRVGGKGPITVNVNPIRIPKKWENMSFQDIEEGSSQSYISIKGCSQECPFCGGSKSSYKNFFFRDYPLALAPEQLIREIEGCEKTGIARVGLLGDIRIMGKKYVDLFLTKLAKRKFNIHIEQELFFPAEPGYLERWQKAAPGCSFLFAINSPDPKVLRRIGSNYTNEETWDLIKNCSRLQLPLLLFFMYGLPGQDAQSIRFTMDFIEKAVEYPYIDFEIAPLFYIDPGSPIFENPGKWGYHNVFRTLKDFKEILEHPHWSQIIKYHTRWISKDEFIDMIFYAAERTSRIRSRQNPLNTLLYLLNIENRELNRKLIEQLRAREPVSDTYTRELIKKIFPSYLLKDNLIVKDHIPNDQKNPYSTFHYLSYLLINIYNVSPHRLLKYFKKWFENADTLPKVLSLRKFKKTDGAPDSIKKEILNIIKDMNIDPVFIENLMDFEWINELASRVNTGKKNQENKQANNLNTGDYSKYKLIVNESVVLKTFKFNFDRVDWVNFSNSEPLIPGTTYYLYSLQKGKGKAISPFIRELLNLCDGKRHITEIIKELKKLDQEKEIAIAMNLGALVSEGILLPQL